MNYPKAGDLQKQMGITLTANPAGFQVKDDRGRVVFTAGETDDIEQALDLFTIWINQDAPRRLRRDDEDPAVTDENGGLTLTFEGDRPATFYLSELAGNPVRYGAAGAEPAEIFAEDADAAVDKYKEFHRYDPRKVEEIRGLVIPRRVRKMGPAAYVLYRSGKVDPATLQKPKRPVDYIHEHDAGVTVYSTEGTGDTDVPKAIYETTALVRLGYCLGFKLKDGTEAQGTAPLPDLCCTPDGKCLLVVQGKKQVLAMFWGGALGVFARGIDG